jgi:hypothetical protein
LVPLLPTHTIDEDGKMSKKKWLGEEGGIVKNGKPHAIKAWSPS